MERANQNVTNRTKILLFPPYGLTFCWWQSQLICKSKKRCPKWLINSFTNIISKFNCKISYEGELTSKSYDNLVIFFKLGSISSSSNYGIEFVDIPLCGCKAPLFISVTSPCILSVRRCDHERKLNSLKPFVFWWNTKAAHKELCLKLVGSFFPWLGPLLLSCIWQRDVQRGAYAKSQSWALRAICWGGRARTMWQETDKSKLNHSKSPPNSKGAHTAAAPSQVHCMKNSNYRDWNLCTQEKAIKKHRWAIFNALPMNVLTVSRLGFNAL